MNMYAAFPSSLTCLGLALLLNTCSNFTASAQTRGATETNSVIKPTEIARSTFVLPQDKSEGRDPFYPDSTYVYDQSKPSNNTNKGPVKVAVVDLKLTAIGGTSERPVASINNRTFSEGEEGEMTINGAKVQIHILDIQEDGVILTVNGEQRELRFRRTFP